MDNRKPQVITNLFCYFNKINKSNKSSLLKWYKLKKIQKYYLENGESRWDWTCSVRLLVIIFSFFLPLVVSKVKTQLIHPKNMVGGGCQEAFLYFNVELLLCLVLAANVCFCSVPSADLKYPPRPFTYPWFSCKKVGPWEILLSIVCA